MTLPTIETILAEEPLYRRIPLEPKDGTRVATLISNHLRFDCYCPDCKKERTFTTLHPSASLFADVKKSTIRKDNESYVNVRSFVDSDWLADTEFSLTAYCSRQENHLMKFYFAIREKHLIKIGQYPSLADIASAELRKYRKVLGQERGAELYKAIGLAANGVGVGSFVYLRRVFEALLEEHKDQAERSGQGIPNYQTMHIGDRIDALKSTLPDFLVGNKVIYGILSLGIHSATEDQCLVAFPVLKNAILLILHQDAERLEREATQKTLATDIAKAASALKGS